MARGGINQVLVQRARTALLARGIHPSIDAVRVELGNTGSRSTIQRYLKELGDTEERIRPPSLTEELQSVIISLAERLERQAQEQLSTERADLERQRTAWLREQAQHQQFLEHLRAANAQMTTELHDQRDRETALAARLNESEVERRRLVQGEQSAQQVLRERATQILSLEDKHRHARDALAHYRQQQLTQREEDLQRQDAQLLQLQQDVRSLREQLLGKQEELGQRYRELERLTVEQHAHGQQVRHLEQQVQHLNIQRKELEEGRELDQTRLQALHHELATLREKAKRYVLRHRQDQRSQRAQAQQLDQAQALLQRLTRAAEPPL